jgi:hypothetical protein
MAFALHHLEGETLEAVARQCGCSLATVPADHPPLQRAEDLRDPGRQGDVHDRYLPVRVLTGRRAGYTSAHG